MANAVIGALRVNLGLDAAQFSKGIKQAESDLARASRQMKATLAVVGAAAAGITAAARLAMDRIDAQAKGARRIGASVDGYRALQLAASEAGVSVDSLADTAQTLAARLVDAERAGTPAAKAIARLGLDARALRGLDADQRLAAIADAVKGLGLDAGETTRLLADLGVKNREMALLIMGGGDALREARQAVEDYGLSLSRVDVKKIEDANDAWGRIGFAAEAAGNRIAVAFAPAMQAVAQAFTDTLRPGGILRETIEVLGANIGRLATYAATFAAFMGARYVAALVAARVATMSFAVSLVAVRTALIRTGIGALIVGAAEIALWVGRAAERVGGFGALLGVVADIASEVWGRIGMGARAMGSGLVAVWQGIKATALSSLDGLILGAAEVANTILNTFRGAYAAVVEVWKALPNALGDLMYQAASLTVRGVEEMVNAIVRAVNGMLSSRLRPMFDVLKYLVPGLQVAPLPTSIPELRLDGVQNPFAGAASAALGDASAAFAGAFAANPFQAPDTGLATAATAAREAAVAAREAGAALLEAATAPLASLEGLAGAIGETTDETEAAREAAAGLADALGEGGGEGGGGGGVRPAAEAAAVAVDTMRSAVERLRETVNEMKSAFQSAFVGIVIGAKSAAEAVGELLKSLATMSANKAFGALWGSVTGWLFGGGMPVTAGAVAGTLIGGTSPGLIPGFASGTSYAPGGLALVGERGPELVNLPRGSRVYSNGETERMMGGGEVAVRVYVDQGGNWHAAVERVAGRVVASAAPGIVGQSVKAVGRLNRESRAFATGRG